MSLSDYFRGNSDLLYFFPKAMKFFPSVRFQSKGTWKEPKVEFDTNKM